MALLAPQLQRHFCTKISCCHFDFFSGHSFTTSLHDFKDFTGFQFPISTVKFGFNFCLQTNRLRLETCWFSVLRIKSKSDCWEKITLSSARCWRLAVSCKTETCERKAMLWKQQSLQRSQLQFNVSKRAPQSQSPWNTANTKTELCLSVWVSWNSKKICLWNCN